MYTLRLLSVRLCVVDWRFWVELFHLASSATEHSGYQFFLSDHSQEHVDQLDSTKPRLATQVNTLMSLWRVKELVTGADTLENWDKGEKAKERWKPKWDK